MSATPEPAPVLRDVMSVEIARLRYEARMSARAAAASCQEAGWTSLDRSRIANLESRRGRPLSVEELLGLCYVLRGWPPDVMLGQQPSKRDLAAWASAAVQLTDEVSVPRVVLSQWFTGEWAPWMDGEGPAEDRPLWGSRREPSAEDAMQAIRLLADQFGLRVSFEPVRRG